MIRHIVFHKYTQPQQAQVIAPLLRALVGKVPGLVSMEAGADFLHSERSYDLALIATLQDRAALEVYASHPEHVKIKELAHKYIEKTVAVDFEF
ncbi:MAG: Dabb family protein [Christensenellaceae bacterium]|jgi:hypothetical protein|nr:Dabb family protein [Christensenellaceae bacterium]